MKPVRLEPIRTKISNLYLLIGERPVLVDTGNPGKTERVVSTLGRFGYAPEDLALIVLTHAHADHLGSAASLRERTGAPIALHAADILMARSGRQPLRPTGLDGRLLARFFSDRFEPLEPDIVFDGETSLEAYGVNARVIETPGHTPGSVSVILPDNQAIIGDVVRGDFTRPDRPTHHLFADDPTTVGWSIQRLIGLPLTRLHPGHGRAFTRASLERRFARHPRLQAQEV